jgi:hypothetical protein
MGAGSASSYRPVAIASTAHPTSTGSVSITHSHINGATDLNPVYNDGGTNIVRKHNARFILSTSLTGASTFNITVTMTNLVAGTASDIRLAQSNSSTTVTNAGTHSANTGTAPNPTVGRTAVALANLPGDYRVTTINSTATPLPIVLLYFAANVDGDHVRTEWTTSREINNHFFTLQKTIDFETFYDVESVDGRGNSDAESTYSVTDNHPFPGRSYYRLKQTDFDGNATNSNPVMIDFHASSGPVLSVYPNPTVGNSVTIQISGLSGDAAVPVEIFNLLGVRVYNATLEQEIPGLVRTKIEFNGALPHGTYIVKAGKTMQLTRKLAIK